MLGALPAAVYANNWEKVYRASPAGTTPILPYNQPPQVVDLSTDPQELVNSMWRRGFAMLGVSSFNSPNASTKDALWLGEKIHAAYRRHGHAGHVIADRQHSYDDADNEHELHQRECIGVRNWGFANGTYSGTTKIYGSQTTYISITGKCYDKIAV